MTPRAPSARMYDGTAQAWVGTEARGHLAGVQTVWERSGPPFACAVQTVRQALADRAGAGESEVGDWNVYAPIDDALRLRPGMVVEVLSGPEEGKTLSVDQDYTPRMRFQQVPCRQWDGELPEGS